MLEFTVLVLDRSQNVESQRTFSATRIPCVNEILIFPSKYSNHGEMQQVLLVAHLNFANSEPMSVVACHPPGSGVSDYNSVIEFFQQSWKPEDWRNLNMN